MTSINDKPLTTVNGKFYVGMTVQEAKEKNLYESSLFQTGFIDIDKDNNGVLSSDEICSRRDKECKNCSVATVGTMVLSCAEVVIGSVFLPVGGGALATAGGINMGSSCFAMREILDEQEKTKQYRQAQVE